MRSLCHVNISRLYKRHTLFCSAFLLSPSFTYASAPLLFSLHPDPEVWVRPTTTTTILQLATRLLSELGALLNFFILSLVLLKRLLQILQWLLLEYSAPSTASTRRRSSGSSTRRSSPSSFKRTASPMTLRNGRSCFRVSACRHSATCAISTCRPRSPTTRSPTTR